MEAGILFVIGVWVLAQAEGSPFFYIVGAFIIFVSIFY